MKKKNSMTGIIAVMAIAISGLFIAGCEKAEFTEQEVQTTQISQEMITPQAIISGEIDPGVLSNEQQEKFLLAYTFTESGVEELPKEVIYSSRMLMKYLTADDIVQIIASNRDYNLSEKELWFMAFISKELSNLYPRDIEDLSSEEYDLILDRAQRNTIEKLEGVSDIKSSMISTCNSYTFDFNAYESSTYNRSCYFLSDADNDENSYICDYMLCFTGYGEGLYANTTVIDGLITNTYVGFGGYGNMIIRKIGSRTYVLFGSIRTVGYLFTHGITDYKGYLKTNVKIKV